MKLMEDEVLEQFLENAVAKAKEQIREEGKLTVETAMPLLLKSQFNHIIHLDTELKNISEKIANMATKDEIKNMATKDDIKNMATKDDIKNMATKDDIIATKNDIRELKSDMKHWLMYGFALLGLLFTLVTIFLK